MTLASPNEPTEGPGGMRVVDVDGLEVGRVLPPTELDPPSEDIARVAIALSDEAVQRLGLAVREADVEATWLEAPDEGDFLRLDRPLVVALREQGFDV